MTTPPPSSLHLLLPYSLPRLPFHLRASPPPLYRSFLSLLLYITTKMVAVETRLFGNGGRKTTPALCLSIFFDAAAWMRAHMLPREGVRSVSVNARVGVCVRVCPILWGSSHTCISHLKSFICTKPLLQTLLPWLQPARTTDTMTDTVAMATLGSVLGNMIIHGWGIWHITGTWICSSAGKPACRW